MHTTSNRNNSANIGWGFLEKKRAELMIHVQPGRIKYTFCYNGHWPKALWSMLDEPLVIVWIITSTVPEVLSS